MSNRHITDVAGAVTDGEAIDWQELHAVTAAGPSPEAATTLRMLSELPRAEPAARAPDRRLPLALEFARLIAICSAVPAVLGELVGTAMFGRTGHVVVAIVMTAFAGAALYLDLGGRDRRARALAACYWMAAASFSASTFRWLMLNAGDAVWPRLVTGIRPETLFAAGLWEFAREFPVLTRFSRLDRVCSTARRIATAVGLALFAINVGIAIAPASKFAAATKAFNGVLARPMYWNAIFLLAFPAVVTIGLRARKAHGHESRRARLFLYSIVVAFVPLIVEVLAEGFFPSYGRMMRRPTGRLIGSLIIYPLQIALPIVTAYAVVVDNVLEVQVAVQRGLRYLLAKTVVAWGAALPFAGLVFYVYVHRDQPLSAALSTTEARPLVWAGGVAMMVLALRQHLIRALDRWALPGLEDGSTMLATMAASLKNTRTRIEVVAALMTAAERALQAQAEGYVAHDGHLIPVRAGAVPLPADSVIAVLLEGARGPCVVSADHGQSYFRLLTSRDREWITTEKTVVLVPVMASRGRGGLAGVVALKGRRNAMAFSQDDLRFLSAASASASLASDLLEAEDHVTAGSATERDELANECARCGRVAGWTSPQDACSCGGAWRRAALPQHLLRRFVVTGRLGAGGMGIVYRATDVALHRDVAIKTLTGLSESAADRLVTEARTMAGISHVNVAVLYSVETWKNTPLLVMEYLSGGTLAERLRTSPLAPADAVSLVRGLASTLEHLHRAGMYHGDIKPSNIAFTADGMPKLLDFGLTRTIAGAAAVSGGTPAYMPIDVQQGAAPGPSLDVWALAIVLGECLTGERHMPFERRPHTADELLDALEGLHV